MSFIPENYKQPKSDSGYLKIEDGENLIRILTTPLMGWEGWVSEGETRRPYRVEFHKKEQCQTEDTVKHFWALGVYNYDEKAIQIWVITQATIIEYLTKLSSNSKWGDPRYYDITVVRSGEKMNTKYSVLPNPKEPLSAEIKVKYKAKPFDLTKLFSNEDPFEVPEEEDDGSDPLPWEKTEKKKAEAEKPPVKEEDSIFD